MREDLQEWAEAGVLLGARLVWEGIFAADKVLSINPYYPPVRDWWVDILIGPEDFYDDAPVTDPNSPGSRR